MKMTAKRLLSVVLLIVTAWAIERDVTDFIHNHPGAEHDEDGNWVKTKMTEYEFHDKKKQHTGKFMHIVDNHMDYLIPKSNIDGRMQRHAHIVDPAEKIHTYGRMDTKWNPSAHHSFALHDDDIIHVECNERDSNGKRVRRVSLHHDTPENAEKRLKEMQEYKLAYMKHERHSDCAFRDTPADGDGHKTRREKALQRAVNPQDCHVDAYTVHCDNTRHASHWEIQGDGEMVMDVRHTENPDKVDYHQIKMDLEGNVYGVHEGAELLFVGTGRDNNGTPVLELEDPFMGQFCEYVDCSNWTPAEIEMVHAKNVAALKDADRVVLADREDSLDERYGEAGKRKPRRRLMEKKGARFHTHVDKYTSEEGWFFNPKTAMLSPNFHHHKAKELLADAHLNPEFADFVWHNLHKYTSKRRGARSSKNKFRLTETNAKRFVTAAIDAGVITEDMIIPVLGADGKVRRRRLWGFSSWVKKAFTAAVTWVKDTVNTVVAAVVKVVKVIVDVVVTIGKIIYTGIKWIATGIAEAGPVDFSKDFDVGGILSEMASSGSGSGFPYGISSARAGASAADQMLAHNFQESQWADTGSFEACPILGASKCRSNDSCSWSGGKCKHADGGGFNCGGCKNWHVQSNKYAQGLYDADADLFSGANLNGGAVAITIDCTTLDTVAFSSEGPARKPCKMYFEFGIHMYLKVSNYIDLGELELWLFMNVDIDFKLAFDIMGCYTCTWAPFDPPGAWDKRDKAKGVAGFWQKHGVMMYVPYKIVLNWKTVLEIKVRLTLTMGYKWDAKGMWGIKYNKATGKIDPVRSWTESDPKRVFDFHLKYGELTLSFPFSVELKLFWIAGPVIIIEPFAQIYAGDASAAVEGNLENYGNVGSDDFPIRYPLGGITFNTGLWVKGGLKVQFDEAFGPFKFKWPSDPFELIMTIVTIQYNLNFNTGEWKFQVLGPKFCEMKAGEQDCSGAGNEEAKYLELERSGGSISVAPSKAVPGSCVWEAGMGNGGNTYVGTALTEGRCLEEVRMYQETYNLNPPINGATWNTSSNKCYHQQRMTGAQASSGHQTCLFTGVGKSVAVGRCQPWEHESCKQDMKTVIVSDVSWCSQTRVNDLHIATSVWTDMFKTTIEGNQLTVQRIDGVQDGYKDRQPHANGDFGGWGMNLVLRCFKDRTSCSSQVVTFGRSNYANSKNMNVPGAQDCSNDRVNTDYASASDSFAVTVSGPTVTARRTDSSGGWGMNLQIKCSVCAQSRRRRLEETPSPTSTTVTVDPRQADPWEPKAGDADVEWAKSLNKEQGLDRDENDYFNFKGTENTVANIDILEGRIHKISDIDACTPYIGGKFSAKKVAKFPAVNDDGQLEMAQILQVEMDHLNNKDNGNVLCHQRSLYEATIQSDNRMRIEYMEPEDVADLVGVYLDDTSYAEHMDELMAELPDDPKVWTNLAATMFNTTDSATFTGKDFRLLMDVNREEIISKVGDLRGAVVMGAVEYARNQHITFFSDSQGEVSFVQDKVEEVFADIIEDVAASRVFRVDVIVEGMAVEDANPVGYPALCVPSPTHSSYMELWAAAEQEAKEQEPEFYQEAMDAFVDPDSPSYIKEVTCEDHDEKDCDCGNDDCSECEWDEPFSATMAYTARLEVVPTTDKVNAKKGLWKKQMHKLQKLVNGEMHEYSLGGDYSAMSAAEEGSKSLSPFSVRMVWYGKLAKVKNVHPNMGWNVYKKIDNFYTNGGYKELLDVAYYNYCGDDVARTDVGENSGPKSFPKRFMATFTQDNEAMILDQDLPEGSHTPRCFRGYASYEPIPEPDFNRIPFKSDPERLKEQAGSLPGAGFASCFDEEGRNNSYDPQNCSKCSSILEMECGPADPHCGMFVDWGNVAVKRAANHSGDCQQVQFTRHDGKFQCIAPGLTTGVDGNEVNTYFLCGRPRSFTQGAADGNGCRTFNGNALTPNFPDIEDNGKDCTWEAQIDGNLDVGHFKMTYDVNKVGVCGNSYITITSGDDSQPYCKKSDFGDDFTISKGDTVSWISGKQSVNRGFMLSITPFANDLIAVNGDAGEAGSFSGDNMGLVLLGQAETDDCAPTTLDYDYASDFAGDCSCEFMGIGTTLKVQYLCQTENLCYNQVEDWCAPEESICEIPH